MTYVTDEDALRNFAQAEAALALLRHKQLTSEAQHLPARRLTMDDALRLFAELANQPPPDPRPLNERFEDFKRRLAAAQGRHK